MTLAIMLLGYFLFVSFYIKRRISLRDFLNKHGRYEVKNLSQLCVAPVLSVLVLAAEHFVQSLVIDGRCA